MPHKWCTNNEKARIVTAPASGQFDSKPDSGHGSSEHRSVDNPAIRALPSLSTPVNRDCSGTPALRPVTDRPYVEIDQLVQLPGDGLFQRLAVEGLLLLGECSVTTQLVWSMVQKQEQRVVRAGSSSSAPMIHSGGIAVVRGRAQITTAPASGPLRH